MANVVNTPGGDTMMNNMFSDNINLTSMESFEEPAGKDDLLRGNGGGGLAGKARRPPPPSQQTQQQLQQSRQQEQQYKASSMYTPQQGNRAVFGELRNRGPQHQAPQGEFTPLLKSVHRDNMVNKLNGALGQAGQQTPLFMKENMMGNSPALPRPDSSEIDGSSYTGEATPVAMAQGMTSSEASTPMPQLKGKGGVLDDGQLTLREQEKIIDEIKKENFGLKLKIFFLDERLGKLGPEVNDQALKENVEIKVERATLKAELKRYKKSLLDSERLIAELRNQAMENQSDAQKRYADQQQSHKDQEVIQDLMDQLAQKEDDIRARDEDIRRLKAEIADRDSTEQEDAQELERLQKQINDLNAEVEDLQTDLNAKDEQLENRRDAQDKEIEELRERIQELETELEGKDHDAEQNGELVSRIERLKDKLREARDEIFRLQGELEEKANVEEAELEQKGLEIKTLTQKLQSSTAEIKRLEDEKMSLTNKVATYEDEREGAESELANKVMDLEFDLNQLRTQLGDAKDQAEDAEDEANRLRQEIQSLNEKHQDEIENVRDEMREKSVTMKSRVQERDENRLRLQKELDKLHNEHNSLVLLHNERNQEVQSLKTRIEELTGSFAGDARELQSHITALTEERDGANRLRADIQAQKDLLQHRHDALTSESQILQDDIARLQQTLKDTSATLSHERDLGRVAQRNLKTQLHTDKSNFEEKIERLQAAVEEKQNFYARNKNDWDLEKNQLMSKSKREAEKIASLEATVRNLRQANEYSVNERDQLIQKQIDMDKELHAAEVVALKQQITDLGREIERRKNAFEETNAELQSVKDDLRQTKKADQIAEDKVHSLEDRIKSLTSQQRQELNDVNEKLAEAESICESLRSELKDCKESYSMLQTQLRMANQTKGQYEDDLKTGTVSQEHLKSQLQLIEGRLEATKKEKTNLQEQLRTANTRIADVKSRAQDIEAERDELRDTLANLNQQVGSNQRLDQEKSELRRAKNKLEIEMKHLQSENEKLANQAEELEAELEEACKQAVEDEKKLELEISSLKAKLKSANEGNEKNSQAMRREIAGLKDLVQQLQEQSDDNNNGADPAELEALNNNLALFRQREQDLKKGERAAKDQVRELRQKVHHLEADLHEAKMSRPRSPNDAMAQQERHELHGHIMNARLQIEELQHQVEQYEKDIGTHNVQEKELYDKIKSLRSQRTAAENQSKKSELELQKLRGKLERNKEKVSQLQQQLDEETKALKKKIIQETRAVKEGVAEADERHKKELKGLMKNNKYLRARVAREESFRQDLCFTKKFFMMMVNLYGACNEANLQMLAQMGIVPDITIREKRPTLRAVGHVIIATIRMRNRRQEWSPNEALGKTLASKLHQARTTSTRTQSSKVTR